MSDSWQCPKCVGDCVCKSCSKSRPSSRKRAAASADEYEEEQDEEEAGAGDEDASSLLFFAPPPPPSRKQALASLHSLAALPGRQPVLPPGFQLHAQTAPATASPSMPKERIVGMLHYDASTPVHRKALELARQKEHCDSTIANMQGLLAMLQRERAVLDGALNELIKQTTSQIGAGLARTASVAQFEDLLLSPPSKGLRKSGSHCNLEAAEDFETANKKIGF